MTVDSRRQYLIVVETTEGHPFSTLRLRIWDWDGSPPKTPTPGDPGGCYCHYPLATLEAQSGGSGKEHDPSWHAWYGATISAAASASFGRFGVDQVAARARGMKVLARIWDGALKLAQRERGFNADPTTDDLCAMLKRCRCTLATPDSVCDHTNLWPSGTDEPHRPWWTPCERCGDGYSRWCVEQDGDGVWMCQDCARAYHREMREGG